MPFTFSRAARLATIMECLNLRKVQLLEMEKMMAAPGEDGDAQQTRSTIEIVSTVLNKNSANSKFLKNVGLETDSVKTTKTATERLEENLEEERRIAPEQQQIIENEERALVELRQKAHASDEAMAKRDREIEELKKWQDEIDAIIFRGFMRHGGQPG